MRKFRWEVLPIRDGTAAQLKFVCGRPNWLKGECPDFQTIRSPSSPAHKALSPGLPPRSHLLPSSVANLPSVATLMDVTDSLEKAPHDEAAVATRAVAFPDAGADIQEKAIHVHGARPKGVEMKREMTKEDKELADAGYDELNQEKAQAHANAKLDNVDINEHMLSFKDLQADLDTTFDAKDPGLSPGLTSEDAKTRLTRDGPNVLTPPKKKSALRKVRGFQLQLLPECSRVTRRLQYYDCLMTMFNILLIIAGILEYILLGVDFKVRGPCLLTLTFNGPDVPPFRTTSPIPISAAS